MNRIPVFLSFDYESDREVKNNLVSQWGDERCPIWIKDCSLQEPVTNPRWQTDAAKLIDGVKAVLVVCGRNTHSANGVITEVQLALARNKPIIFLRGRKEGATHPRGIDRNTPMVPLDWDSVYEQLSPLANR